MNDGRADDHGMDAETAERLLRAEEFTEPDATIAGLAAVLAAAARPLPGRPEDAQAALAHFRAEHAGRRGRGPLRAVRGARPTVVVAGAAAAVLALGGVVIAAQTGALPHPFGPGTPTHSPPPTATASPGPTGTARARGTHRPTAPATATPSTRTTPTASASSPGPAPGASAPSRPASPPPLPAAGGASSTEDLKGLCEAYERSAQQGRTTEVPIPAPLAQAAGGDGLVGSYCARLTGDPAPHGSPPADDQHPTGPPAGDDDAAPAHGAASGAGPAEAGSARCAAPAGSGGAVRPVLVQGCEVGQAQ